MRVDRLYEQHVDKVAVLRACIKSLRHHWYDECLVCLANVFLLLLSGHRASLLSKKSGKSGISSDRLRGARILLVEDNEINQEVAIGLLAHAKVSVDLAENGAAALGMIRDNEYDAVLMDVQMPVMDGIEATRILRADQRHRALPIIAMTADAMASDRDRCLEVGMNDHIAKPIDPEQVFGVLARWIRYGRDGKLDPSRASAVPHNAAGDNALEIPGIDVRSGLRRTGGNFQHYMSRGSSPTNKPTR